MAVANTIAYYVTTTITTEKSFIVQAPGGIFTKLFFSVTDGELE